MVAAACCLFSLLTIQEETFQRPGVDDSSIGLYLSGAKPALISSPHKFFFSWEDRIIMCSDLQQQHDQDYMGRATISKNWYPRDSGGVENWSLARYTAPPFDGSVKVSFSKRTKGGAYNEFRVTLNDPNEKPIYSDTYARAGSLSDISMNAEYRDSTLDFNIIESAKTTTRATLSGSVTFQSTVYDLNGGRVLNRGWWKAVQKSTQEVVASGTMQWCPTDATIPKESEAWKPADQIHVWADAKPFGRNIEINELLTKRSGF